MTIGNASISYVDTQISQISYINDGTSIIKSKSINSDGGNITSDGSGNITVKGSIINQNSDSIGAQMLMPTSSTSYRWNINSLASSGNTYDTCFSFSGGVKGVDGMGQITVSGGSITLPTTVCDALTSNGAATVGSLVINGTGTATTPTTTDNSTNIATTAYVQAQGYFPLSGGTVTGKSTFNEDITFDGNIIIKGSMLFDSQEWLVYNTTYNALSCSKFLVTDSFNNYYANGQGFEFGTASSISFIDFHSVANTTNDNSTVNDYDVRIAVLNGVSGTSGKGDLSITSNTVGINNTTVTGYLIAPTMATTDNSTNAATTAYVQNQGYATLSYLKSIRGIQNADISASGATMTLTIPNENIIITLKNTSSTSASISYAATTGTITPVDIRRVTMYGGGSNETYTMDGGTLTTTPTVVDDTVYTVSNDTSAHFIRVNGNSYVITVWISGGGARSSLIYEKFV